MAAAFIFSGCTVRRLPAGLSPSFLRVEAVFRLSGLSAVSPPAWSPDGERLAFSTREAVWVVPSDGGEERRVASLPHTTQVAWAPDGRSLAALADGTLYALSPEAMSPRRLSGTRRVRLFAWSPRENRIAYIASRGSHAEVWLVRDDGAAELRVDPVGPGRAEEEARTLAWSADGRDLLIGQGGPHAGRVDRLLQVRASPPTVTQTSLLLREPAASLVVAPFARFLAYLGGPEASPSTGRGRVVVARTDGTGSRVLTGPGTYSGLAWDPSGSLLAFATTGDDKMSVVIAEPLTGEQLPVADYRPEVSKRAGPMAISWAPSGLRIAFGADTGEAAGTVWIVTLTRL